MLANQPQPSTALALQYEGLKVGVLDADITGIHAYICGLQKHELEVTKDNEMLPAQAFDDGAINWILSETEQAQIWRGFDSCKNVAADDQGTMAGLDVLVVDLPPVQETTINFESTA